MIALAVLGGVFVAWLAVNFVRGLYYRYKGMVWAPAWRLRCLRVSLRYAQEPGYEGWSAFLWKVARFGATMRTHQALAAAAVEMLAFGAD